MTTGFPFDLSANTKECRMTHRPVVRFVDHSSKGNPSVDLVYFPQLSRSKVAPEINTAVRLDGLRGFPFIGKQWKEKRNERHRTYQSQMTLRCSESGDVLRFDSGPT